MRAVVVGAGIAGLVAARQLGMAGWDVTLVEQASGPRRDGYMMDFFGPGVEAAARIGLFDRLAGVAYRVEAAQYVDVAGRVTCSIDYERFSRLAGGRVLSLLRPDLEQVALQSLADVPSDRVRVRYGHRYERHGELEPAELLIGADGIHSAIRADLFGPERHSLRPLGMRAAAFIVDEPELHERLRGRFVLTDSVDRTAGLYGLREDAIAAFLVYREDEALEGTPTRERLRAAFRGLGAAVDRVLELCPEHPYDDVVAQVVLPHWHRGNAVLIGDAAGAVSLLAGQGGSLALAGAALLGDLLGPVTAAEAVQPALGEFERRWRPVVEHAQASGRRAAASFLPRNRLQLLLRRWIVRGTRLPGIDRLVARQILRSIAK